MSEDKLYDQDVEQLRHDVDLMMRRLANLGKQENYDFDPSKRDFFSYHPECLKMFNAIWNRLAKLEGDVDSLSPKVTSDEEKAQDDK